MVRLILLELNEINFRYLERYIDKGFLPKFRRVFEKFGYAQTRSETKHEYLEPWIQWVTAHTGKSFSEHKIFRLGDAITHEHRQIWEYLEEGKGMKVGAISPFNGVNRLKKAAFFLPDPWTKTAVTGSRLDRAISDAVSQAVNSNAHGNITLKSVVSLVLGAVSYARLTNYGKYLDYMLNAKACSWYKALFLDLFLADIFINKLRRKQPDFASLFLNAGAHIQHHYMFSSSVYDGEPKNPAWYIDSDKDPVLAAYQLYDAILGAILKNFPASRIMLATGLHQDPCSEIKYYYRLKDHAHFLQQLGIVFSEVHPRMSRDFLITFENQQEASKAEAELLSIKCPEGSEIFYVDNRSTTLFVELQYAKEIKPNFELYKNSVPFMRFAEHVVFVALKNGEHNGIGYFVDTGSHRVARDTVFPLAALPEKITACF